MRLGGISPVVWVPPALAVVAAAACRPESVHESSEPKEIEGPAICAQPESAKIPSDEKADPEANSKLVITMNFGQHGEPVGCLAEDAEGQVVSATTFSRTDCGAVCSSRTYNAGGDLIYRTTFGYSKRPGPTYGKLVQELIFDARVKRFFDGGRNEKPVHMFHYLYNLDGSSRPPIGISLLKTNTEEVLGCPVFAQAGEEVERFALNPTRSTSPDE